MSNPAHDYEALRDQFVHGTMSLHELCRLNEIKSHSPVISWARKHNWLEDRLAFQGKVVDKTDDRVAAKQAMRRERAMEVTDHAFDAVDRVLIRMVEDLNATHFVKRHDSEGAEIWVEEPIVRVTPQAAAALIDRLNALVGRPGTIEEHRGTLDVNLSGLPSNVLAALAEVAGRNAQPRTVGASPIPLLEGPVKAN